MTLNFLIIPDTHLNPGPSLPRPSAENPGTMFSGAPWKLPAGVQRRVLFMADDPEIRFLPGTMLPVWAMNLI